MSREQIIGQNSDDFERAVDNRVSEVPFPSELSETLRASGHTSTDDALVRSLEHEILEDDYINKTNNELRANNLEEMTTQEINENFNFSVYDVISSAFQTQLTAAEQADPLTSTTEQEFIGPLNQNQTVAQAIAEMNHSTSSSSADNGDTRNDGGVVGGSNEPNTPDYNPWAGYSYEEENYDNFGNYYTDANDNPDNYAGAGKRGRYPFLGKKGTS